ncbi:hypothetical protein C5167_017989, partial [Papaver somniferum]
DGCSGGLQSIEVIVVAAMGDREQGSKDHAIFQRLAEDRIFNQIPRILITAKGYPDIATRFLLHRISRAFPNLPIFALVDW